MARNMSRELQEEKSDNASVTINNKKYLVLINTGEPETLLFPPGTVKAAVNMTVAMRVETTIHPCAVSFIHFSPLITMSR
ncbi:hypothetical protein ACHQM5_016893 [Ranunculus cassubicifolius]